MLRQNNGKLIAFKKIIVNSEHTHVNGNRLNQVHKFYMKTCTQAITALGCGRGYPCINVKIYNLITRHFPFLLIFLHISF